MQRAKSSNHSIYMATTMAGPALNPVNISIWISKSLINVGFFLRVLALSVGHIIRHHAGSVPRAQRLGSRLYSSKKVRTPSRVIRDRTGDRLDNVLSPPHAWYDGMKKTKKTSCRNAIIGRDPRESSCSKEHV